MGLMRCGLKLSPLASHDLGLTELTSLANRFDETADGVAELGNLLVPLRIGEILQQDEQLLVADLALDNMSVF